MSLTVRDVENLEEDLLRIGKADGSFGESTLLGLVDCYESEAPGADILDQQSFAQLCECIRSSTDEAARHLALGILAVIQHDGRERPERARFVLRFGIRHLVSRLGHRFGWHGIPLPPADEEAADQLFEVARGDSTYSDEILLSGARAFIDRFEESPDMFGRFAEDLRVLLHVLTREGASEEQKDIARAALVYFVEASDAIPDHLGPVGLLDDALVVRRAVERIMPGRSVLGGFLDSFIGDWPFLRDLHLSTEAGTYTLSEFMIINVAMILADAPDESGSKRRAVVLSTIPPPLPFLIGFVCALAAVRTYADRDDPPILDVGQRLAHRETGAELIFEAYGRYEGRRFVNCSVDEATHFKARHPGKKSAGEVTQSRPMTDLASLVPSNRGSSRLRRGSLNLDRSAAQIGPLERTFGTTSPISIPADAPEVIVIAPVGATKDLANELTLHGSPLIDIISIAQARLDASEIENVELGSRPTGHPLLTIVPSSAEAYELATMGEKKVAAVIGPVRPNATDAANFRKLADDGIAVLALVEENDVESLETLERADFDLWAWDEEWLGYLRWPPFNARGRNHPIAKHERSLANQSSASVEVVRLEFDELDLAFEQLERLQEVARQRDDDLLESAAADGFRTLVSLCRQCVGPAPEPHFGLERFKEHLRSGTTWWSAEAQSAAEQSIDRLEASIRSLRENNPKHEFIFTWSKDNPAATIVTNRQIAERALEAPELSGPTWSVGTRGGFVSTPVLIPAWLGKTQMERVLVPPVSMDLTLALYGPEILWYQALAKRRQASRRRIKALVREHPLISFPSTRLECVPRRDEGPQQTWIVDEVIERARRNLALTELARLGEEETSASLVYFAGGHWAAFSSEYRLNKVTGLDAANESRPDEALRDVTVADLRPGDLVVMVRGSDSDAIRHAADQMLPAGAREMAAEWRAALVRFHEAGHSQADIRRRLAAQGCKRVPQTIRGWLCDDRIIGPKDALDGTIEAIQRTTGDEQLLARLDGCKNAIQLVRSTHFIVAQELYRKVLERTREWLDIDTSPDQLVEVENRLVVLTVEAVDRSPAMVPRSVMNRLREEAA